MEKQKFIVIVVENDGYEVYTQEFDDINKALLEYVQQTSKGRDTKLTLVINVEVQTTIKVDANLDGIKTEYLI